MKENKKINYILLILTIVAFIAVIIAEYFYINNLNSKISNMQEEMKRLGFNQNEKNNAEEKIYSNSELTDYIAELSNAMLGYISYEDDEIKYKGSFKTGKYYNNTETSENSDSIVTIIENNKIQIQIDEKTYLGRYTVENEKLTMNVLLCISEADTFKLKKSVNNEEILFNIIDNDKLKLESTNIDELNNLIGETYWR